ncbi:MAG: NAD(P)-binding domain-containing protein, partial [Nocardioidaceae bacterium]
MPDRAKSVRCDMSGYRIGVVGAGRVGAALAAALRDAGHDVVAASGRSAASATRI